MCGSEGNLVKIRVAGSEMNVCSNCKKMGAEVEKKEDYKHTFRHRVRSSEITEEVVSNFGSLINNALAKKGMDVHHLARGANIKESSLQKYLQGKLKLDVDTAKRLGKFLEIELVEEVEGGSVNLDDVMAEESSSSMSLGDLIKKQMEKGNK